MVIMLYFSYFNLRDLKIELVGSIEKELFFLRKII